MTQDRYFTYSCGEPVFSHGNDRGLLASWNGIDPMTDKRAELRRQWAENNKDRQRQGLPFLKWSEWAPDLEVIIAPDLSKLKESTDQITESMKKLGEVAGATAEQMEGLRRTVDQVRDEP